MEIIGLDLRCLPTDGSPGAGVAHAAREMAYALTSVDAPEITWVVYLPTDALWTLEPSQRVHIESLADATGAALRAGMRRVRCDRLIALSGAVAPHLGVPAIPWVHDLAIFEHPEWFPQSMLRRMATTTLFKRGVIRAPCVLAVSQDTKDALVRTCTLDPSKVIVTHEGGDTILASLHGADLHEAKQRAKARVAERGVTLPFILTLGTIEPRKNLPLLIEAWRRMTTHAADLVIAGRDGWKLGPTLHAMRDVYPSGTGARLHRVSSVTDEDRRDLLLAADVVAVPSRHEGFGLVALEAMQAGSAVLASNAGALPEVVQDAGIVLPTDDADAWAHALQGLLGDEDARGRLAEQAKARSQGLTWGRAAHIAIDGLTKIV